MRAGNYSSLIGKMRPKPLRFQPLTTWAVWLALWAEFAFATWTGRFSAAFVALGTFALTLLPILFARSLHIHVPRRFMAGIVLFIFATLFLGEVGDFYNRYWWWDIFLHGGSALGFGLIGFLAIFMLFQGDRYAAPPWAIGLFAFCFALSIGAVWEIFEFAMDTMFGLNMQKSGLRDTMADLIVDAIGGLLGAVAGVAYLLREEGTPFAGILRDFVTRNRHLFRDYNGRHKGTNAATSKTSESHTSNSDETDAQ